MLLRRSTMRGWAIVLSAGAGLSLLAALNAPPTYAAVSRNKVRLTLLDNCVVDEWHKRTVKDTIADECKCASASVANKLSDTEVSAFKTSLNRQQMSLWNSATKVCFKS